MKLELQVCNLELAKKLKELGVEQDGLYCWEKIHDSWFLARPKECPEESEKYSAFTVAELGEMLPVEYISFKIHGGNKWSSAHLQKMMDQHCQQFFTDKNEANARAKMLIYLLENKLIGDKQ